MRRLVGVVGLISGLWIILLVGTATVVRASNSTAQFIVFNSRDRLMRVNTDGTGLQVLMEKVNPETLASLSPSGRWIIYADYESGRNTLMRMSSDGSSVRSLAAFNATFSNVTWSPDERWIAFVVPAASELDDYGLYHMRRDGTDLRQLTSAVSYHAGYPYGGVSWSPDGEWITFVKALDHHASFPELYRIRADGTDEQVLRNDERTYDPVWSPDGEWLLVTRVLYDELGNADTGIYRIHRDGSDLQRLTPVFEVVQRPVWSPDGAWIAFYGGTYDQADIYRMRADGSDMQQLTYDGARKRNVQWLPTGWITFISDVEGVATLHRMSEDGTDLQHLANLAIDGQNVQWSPIIDLDWEPIALGVGGLVLIIGGVGATIWNGRNADWTSHQLCL